MRVIQKHSNSAADEALDDMNISVAVPLNDSRRAAVERHNRKMHVRAFKQSEMHYVLIARRHGPRTKMST